MKKSVLIIGNYPPPYGGVPHHIERLTGYLIGNGWTCHVLSAGTTGDEVRGALHIYKPTYLRKILALLRQISNRQFDKWRGGETLNTDASAFWVRYKMYADVGAQIIRDHDVRLIVAYNQLTFGPVGAYLSNLFNLPLVINIFGEVYKFDAMLRNKAFFKHMLEEADLLLSCSTHCGNSVKLLGCDRSVHTVTYGIDMSHFSPGEAENLRTRLRIGNNPVILYVGRLSSEMGLDTFIAMSQHLKITHPNAFFLVAGQAGDLSQQALEASQASSGRCIVSQNVSYKELADFYRLATVVVVPTRGDRTCSSLAAMEAMATGKAVVASKVGGIPEIIDNEQTGLLVAPEDTYELIVAVDRLLSDAPLRVRLADAGYRVALQYFSENRVSEVMEKYFISLLDKS